MQGVEELWYTYSKIKTMTCFCSEGDHPLTNFSFFFHFSYRLCYFKGKDKNIKPKQQQ